MVRLGSADPCHGSAETDRGAKGKGGSARLGASVARHEAVATHNEPIGRQRDRRVALARAARPVAVPHDRRHRPRGHVVLINGVGGAITQDEVVRHGTPKAGRNEAERPASPTNTWGSCASSRPSWGSGARSLTFCPRWLRGRQRLLPLALRLAEVQPVTEDVGTAPVLLTGRCPVRPGPECSGKRLESD